MKNRIIAGITMCILLINGLMVSAQVSGIEQDDKLIRKWQSKAEFKVPESVCYDAQRNQLFVANISGKPTDKDNNGFISILSLDGKIVELHWLDGFHAPKGMGVFDNKLYVTDIDRIAEIDIEKREIIRFYPFPEAQFLNDIDIDSEGNIYASDMMDTRIYRISNGKPEIWLDDVILNSPNGLYCHDEYLFIGCKKIVRVPYDTRKIEIYAEETGGIDGIKYLGKGKFIFSDWSGNIFIINRKKKIKNVLNTTAAKINAADIEYIPEMKLLLVPTFYDNRVVAYELK